MHVGNTGQYFGGIISEICIRTFAPSLCVDIVAVFTHSWCQYIKKKTSLPNGEFILVRIHAAHVFAPGRVQEHLPGKLFMYWFRAGE